MFLSLGLLWMSLEPLWRPLGRLWPPFDSLGYPWASFGRPLESYGSLWNALGFPLAGLWGPFGHPGAFGGCLHFITNTYDYRREGLQFDVETYAYRWVG